MALPELRSSFGARVEHAFDGVPGLLSYLVFTTLLGRAPRVARGADLVMARFRRRTWLTGIAATERGPVRVAYLGSPDRLSLWLLDRLGVKAAQERRARDAPGSVDCDVELSLFPENESSRWARAGWLVLPRYVHHRQILGADPTDLERRVGRRARAGGVTLRLTRDPRDLDRFQRSLYDPMLERRHGHRALRTGRALLRLGQRRGGLYLAAERGREIAGAVAAPSAYQPSELEIWALGVAEHAPADAGLLPVLAWIDWARARRYEVVDHVASLPLYSDGLTRQKLRWGTTLSEPIAARELLAVRVHGTGAPLRSWLERHSFAARSREGIVRVEVSDPEGLAGMARSLVGPDPRG